MTDAEINELGPSFCAWLKPLFAPISHPNVVSHLEIYCQGLLSDIERKSVDPFQQVAANAVDDESKHS